MTDKQLSFNHFAAEDMSCQRQDANSVSSPNGGPSVEREKLLHRFAPRLSVRDDFSRKLEMAVVIAELGRIISPGGTVIMVNDNVQYHGEEFPVDFILSDFAEQSGFNCTNIWKLARGKGNSSQQMARFGRRELRKCIYNWIHQ